MTPGPQPTDVIERIVARLVPTDGDDPCWEWTGAKDPKGYGRFTVGSRTDGTRRRARVHRVMWEAVNERAVPKGMVVRHRCDNPSCARPEHLVLGTQRQNVRDAIVRGRMDPFRIGRLKREQARMVRRQRRERDARAPDGEGPTVT